jgi:hypothetical protein
VVSTVDTKCELGEDENFEDIEDSHELRLEVPGDGDLDKELPLVLSADGLR